MLPLSHTFVATKVLGRKSDLLVLGSALPDIRVISDSEALSGLHGKPADFFTFVRKNYPDLKDLALGVRLHCAEDRGADFYSDDRKTGYAILHAAAIEEGIEEIAPNLGTDRIILAHNFIEAALELKVQELDPAIADMYEAAMEGVRYRDVALCLADFLKLDNDKLYDDLISLKQYFSKENLSKKEGLYNIAAHVISIRFKQNYLSKEKTLDLITRSEKLVENSFEEFFSRTISAIKGDLKKLTA